MEPLEILQELDKVTLFDYFKRKSMPDFVEPLVSTLVKSFKSYSEDQRLRALSAVSPRVASVLGWYARKLAGRAVREHSREDLSDGLLALLISLHDKDPRDAMPVLALLYNSALLLEEETGILSEMASTIPNGFARKFIGDFLSRPMEQRSIRNFGFSEGRGPHGFDYIPLLPEYGGPTPLKGKSE